MIVNCEKCNKKFNLDEKLIPENGRLLKCSSCSHEWHFFLEKVPILLNDENKDKLFSESNELSFKKEININTSENKKKNTKESEIKIKTNNDNNYVKKNTNYFVSYLLILLISIIALIVIIDTFQHELSTYMPKLIPILENLYQSLNDILLFAKDLFY